MVKSVAHLAFQVTHELVSLIRSLLLEILQPIACHVRTLSEHVVKVSEFFLSQHFLFLDVGMHLIALSFNFGDDLLLIGDSSFLFLYEAVSDTLKLSTDWVQCVVMILYSITFLLLDCRFELVHALVVNAPSLTEDLTLFVDLTGQIVTQLAKPVLKFFLKVIENIMYVSHRFRSLLLVFLNLGVCVSKPLLKLSLRLDTGILHILKVLTHVLHLVLEVCQIRVIP